MDPLNFPTAIVTTVIALSVVLASRKIARDQLQTGRKGPSDLFLFACVGAGGLIFYFRDAHPFIWNLMANLTGMLIGVGVVWAVIHGANALRRVQRQ